LSLEAAAEVMVEVTAVQVVLAVIFKEHLQI
jgi:hypothetical protein